MTTETREVICSGLPAFMYQVQELIQQGWEIDVNKPPMMLGFKYKTWMIKNDRKAIANAERVIAGAPPKKSRAEILEAARAAKKAKGGGFR